MRIKLIKLTRIALLYLNFAFFSPLHHITSISIYTLLLTKVEQLGQAPTLLLCNMCTVIPCAASKHVVHMLNTGWRHYLSWLY